MENVFSWIKVQLHHLPIGGLTANANLISHFTLFLWKMNLFLDYSVLMLCKQRMMFLT